MAIFSIVLLVVLNGVFAMAEMAVVSSRKAKLQQLANEGSSRAQMALDLARNPDRFLSTIQIGITLIGILAGAIGQRGLLTPISGYLQRFPILQPYSESIAFGLIVVLLTYFSLIIGELVPKRLALHNPEGIASSLAGPMHFLSRLGAPAVRLLSGSTRLVLSALGSRPSDEPPVTEEEINVMLKQGTDAGVFEEAEHDIVKGIFKLGDRAVGALMRPRRDVVWLDLNESVAENQRRVASSMFSRFPVAHGSLDNVVGIVHTKDLLTRCMAGRGMELQEALRTPLFVPDALPALKLLELFKKSRTHIALVVDEYGGVEGLITLNDVLEDIVGEVASVDMPQETPVIQRADGSWLIDGKLSIEELKEVLKTESLPEDDSGSYQTFGGFVMLQIGRVPVAGDHFESTGFTFEVVDMDDKRVDKVLVTKVPEVSQGDEAKRTDQN